MNEDIGFVLSVAPYREYDAMVLFLGEQYGLLRFVLRGYYKPGSKQGALGLEFSKVRYRFKYRPDALLRIQTGELINGYSEHRYDFTWLTLSALVVELCTRFYDDAHRALWVKRFDEMLADGDMAMITLIVIELIKQMGYRPYVQGCVLTQSKQVSDFSIEHGGFVSLPYRKSDSKVDLETLKVLRTVFTEDKLDILMLRALPQLDNLVKLCVEYLQYHGDVKFNSWKLISSV